MSGEPLSLPSTTAQPAPGDPAGPAAYPRRRPQGTTAAAAAVLALAVLIGLVLTAFALPALHSHPRGLPIGVAAPAPVAAQISGGLAQQQPGAFAVEPYADQAALTEAIKARKIYGGIAVTPQGSAMLTSSAAAPVVAQALAGMAAAMGQAEGIPIQVTDVVRLPAGDARGVGIGAALLPLLIGGVAIALGMGRLLRGRVRQLIGLAVAAPVLGATLAALLLWYGAIDTWLLPAGAFALALAAIAATLLGLVRLAGMPGFALGVVVFLLLGNPLSGAQTAPEFLPGGWRELGQILPFGAAGQLFRSTFYFDGAGAARGVLILTGWIVVGVLLILLGRKEPSGAEGVAPARA